MDTWLTIEIQDGDFVSAAMWQRAHGEALVEAAVTNGAQEWEWHAPPWGVALEIRFADEHARERFRGLPAVTAALDAVPDPLGLAVYPGRGGGSGAGVPRHPRPAPLAGAAEVEEPRDQFLEIGEEACLLSAPGG